METKLEYQKVKVGTNLTTMSESWEHRKIYEFIVMPHCKSDK